MATAPPPQQRPPAEEKLKAQVPLNTLGDKFKAFMKTGEPIKPAEPPAKLPAQPHAPEPSKPDEPKSAVPKLEPKEAPVIPEKPAEISKTEKTSEERKTKLPHENFKQLEAARDDFKNKWETSDKRLKDLERQLQEAASAKSPELEASQARVKELESFFHQFELERDPEFKKAFDKRIEVAIMEAKDAVGTQHAEKLDKILRAPPGEWRNERIKEMAAELTDEYDKGGLRDAYRNLNTIQRERAEELERAGENLKALEQNYAKREQQQREQAKLERSKLFKAALNQAAATFPEFRESDSPEHNTKMAENRAYLETFITADLTPEEHGRLATWAVKGLRALETEGALRKELASLKEELAKLVEATPSPSGRGADAPVRRGPPTAADAISRYKKALADGVPTSE